MAASAIFELSRSVHDTDEMQLKAQRIAEENELQRQAMQDSEFDHLMTPSAPSQMARRPSMSVRRQAEPPFKVKSIKIIQSFLTVKINDIFSLSRSCQIEYFNSYFHIFIRDK
jgi:hypothetical protein